MSASTTPSPAAPAPTKIRPFTVPQRLLAFSALVIFASLAIGTGFKMRPWWDEASHGVPAATLITHGYMGTPCYDGSFSNLKDVDHYLYWLMPVYPLAQAVWYLAVPFSIISMRIFSTVIAIGALLCWAYFFRRLTKNNTATVFFLLLASCDYLIITAGAMGRPDILALFFQAAAFACYVRLRENKFGWAVLASQTCVVLSGMTHPNGGMLSFLAMTFLTVYLDRPKIRAWHFALAAAPYLAGAAGWGWYISQDQSAFMAQYGYQTTGRLIGFAHPLTAIQREITDRYFAAMGVITSLHTGGPQIFKALVFLSYFAGCIGVATTPELRRRSENRLLLFIIGLFLIFFVFLEMTKAVYYFPYLTCFYEGALAVWLAWLWQRKSKRMVAMAVLGVVMVVGAGGALLRIRVNTWGPYARAVEVLKRNSGPNDRIAGSQELGFSIGFTPRFLDDMELGIKNGITPDLIFIERIYSERFETIRIKRPDEYPEVMRRLAAYTPLYEQDEYRVLKRRVLTK